MKNAVLVSVCLLSLGLSFVLWSDAGRRKLENQQLQARIADLEMAATQAAADAQSTLEPSPDEQAQKRDLMRLRNEVTQLREAVHRAQTERARARSSAAKHPELAATPDGGQNIPRDEWKFAGYDTPEAALLSGMWAMKEGQREALLNSFTPEERERFETQMPEKTDAEIAQRFQKQYGRVTGVRVLAQHETTPG